MARRSEQPDDEESNEQSHWYRGPLAIRSESQRDAHNASFLASLRYGRGSEQAKTAQERFKAIAPRESYALLTTADPGFLVPEDFSAQVISDLGGFAAFRNIARVEQTGSDTLVIPSVNPAAAARQSQGYVSGFVGAWKAQRTASGGATALTIQDQPVFGQERIPVHRWEPDAIELSRELIEDSKADIFGILSEIIAETRAMDEDNEFTSGDGQGRPLGILNAGLATVNSGNASALTYAGLTSLFTTLPAQYRTRASVMMSSSTYGSIFALEDTGSNLIFPPNSLPNTIFGRPIVFNEFLDDVGAGNIPIIFGDFSFYVIADRMELRLQRLDERVAPNVAILPFARLGGQVVRTNAFRTQTISA